VKIDNTSQPGVGIGAAPPMRGRTPGKTESASGATEDVRLSELAARIQPARDEATIDVARVAEIKKAISEGRFTINAGAIAERLIDTAKELLGAQRRA
jgi:negative regulator of flagellin synthesis FlgM